MVTKQFKELSEETMEQAVKAARQGDLVGVFKPVYLEFGHDLSDVNSPPFRAWDYEIPMEQWMQICAALQRATNRFNERRDPIQQVNYMLDWVNLGPSAHDSEDPS